MDYLFPERFTFLLNNSNMTYEQIAKELGLKSKGTISKYASGKVKKIELSMLVKISELFDVSPIWLLGFTDDMHYKIKNNIKYLIYFYIIFLFFAIFIYISIKMLYEKTNFVIKFSIFLSIIAKTQN